MPLSICLQNPEQYQDIPSLDDFTRWSNHTLDVAATHALPEEIEVTIRIVSQQESAELNQQFRQKSGPTNILSFHYHNDTTITPYELGDLVICAQVVQSEARQQKKTTRDHWAHLTVHGILHLLGYDHIEPPDADHMEQVEMIILKHFNVANPYE